MTLGSGIFASTVLLIVVLALWQATKHGKWKTIGKIAALLLVVGTLLGLGVWGWNVYASRPQVQNQLDGIALGATQIDVQLTKGKPARELAKEGADKDVRWIFFDDPQREDQFTLVLFRKGDSSDVPRASIVCRHAGYVTLLGFSNYADETAIINKLGKPTNTSIRADGLAKTISFEQWKAAFEFEKGAMTTICISESGKVRYAEEHGDKPSEDGGESK